MVRHELSKQGRVQLDDLEYRVELREDPLDKSRERTLPQPYQAAIMIRDRGGRIMRGDTIGFVKVRPFKYRDDISQSNQPPRQALTK